VVFAKALKVSRVVDQPGRIRLSMAGKGAVRFDAVAMADDQAVEARHAAYFRRVVYQTFAYPGPGFDHRSRPDHRRARG